MHALYVFVCVFAVDYLDDRDLGGAVVHAAIIVALVFPVALWMARSGQE